MITNNNIQQFVTLLFVASIALVLVPVLVGALICFIAAHAVALTTVAGTVAVCVALLPVDQYVPSCEIVW